MPRTREYQIAARIPAELEYRLKRLLLDNRKEQREPKSMSTLVSLALASYLDVQGAKVAGE